MFDNIYKLLKQSNKKSYKSSNSFILRMYTLTYPCMYCVNTQVTRHVWNKGNKRLSTKRLNLGPEKYIVLIEYVTCTIKITHKSISFYEKVPSSAFSLFGINIPEGVLKFKSDKFENDFYFNLSMNMPDLISPAECEQIRKFMERGTRYNYIEILTERGAL